MPFTKAAQLADIPRGKGKEVTIAGKSLALFNINGAIYAIDNLCTHRAAPLAEGECWGTEVECPLHGARFDLTTGANLCPPAKTGVRTYPVRVVGDDVEIDV